MTVFGTFPSHFCVSLIKEVFSIMREERIKLNAVGEFIKQIDIIGNSTDKTRKMMVEKLKEVLADIRSVRRKLIMDIRHK